MLVLRLERNVFEHDTAGVLSTAPPKAALLNRTSETPWCMYSAADSVWDRGCWWSSSVLPLDWEVFEHDWGALRPHTSAGREPLPEQQELGRCMLSVSAAPLMACRRGRSSAVLAVQP